MTYFDKGLDLVDLAREFLEVGLLEEAYTTWLQVGLTKEALEEGTPFKNFAEVSGGVTYEEK